ncbi:MAG TPA: carboxypeptidase-like regulatory domain-containing protein, partial [Vicinamibacterales bacterium]|nr:carboxypeptidase-like regulatory domain-containing protein [Vicinamibacterales bacterium]
MKHYCTGLLFGLMIAVGSTSAFAQGGVTSSIAGVVEDISGGTIPGATVVARNNATGFEYTAVTSQNGTFTFGAVPPGTYTVTITLSGFKTVVQTGVVVRAGVPGDVRATLEVGGIEEVVEVQGRSEIVQTQTSAVSTTFDVNQISNLPLISRSALDFVVNLPGVNTPSGNRQSTVNGLPRSAINITIDGMSVQDNHLKTGDGFFARVTPRLDAVEEVTVSSAAQGADAAGQGAVQIRFVTRSGGNAFSGSVYHYFRSDALNTNTWFNERDGLDKPELLQNQPGFRAGGPINIPGVYDGTGRMFYFVNYEEFRQPQTIRRNRTILTPAAQAGVFSYNSAAGVRSVDLLALAAANGHIPTMDPAVAQLLADIRSSTSGAGSITDLEDPVLQRFSWNVNQRSLNKYPTGKIDFNVSENHRFTVSGNWHHINSNPDTLNGRDPQFPGMAVQGTQDSYRYTIYGSLRSTLRGSIVNEFKVGGTGGPTYFANEIGSSMWSSPFGNEAGYKLGISAADISNPSSGSSTSSREASTKILENTVNWVRGAHSFNFGGAFTQADVWLYNQTHVPTITFDVAT